MRKIYFKATLLALAMSVVWLAGGVAKAKDNSWGHISDPAERFQVLANFAGEAVLDRETGLIWEQCPVIANEITYIDAVLGCYNRSTGGTKGWRLPTAAELMSLVVESNLPIGAPFCDYNPHNPNNNVADFRTSTLDPTDPTKIIRVFTPLDGGTSVATNVTQASMPSTWCVRGGTNDSAGP